MTGVADHKTKLAWLQCARAFAALYVAAFHASGRIDRASAGGVEWYQYFRFGNAGVDLFFVISGFIIVFAHYNDLGRPERLARYACRRVTRIYPPYWVLFISIMPLYFLFPDAGQAYQRHAANLIGSLFLLPVPPKQVIGVAWSLPYEVLFYAAFALAILNKRIGLTILGLWVLGVIAHEGLGLRGGFYANFLFSRVFLNFACGAAIAYVVTTRGANANLSWLLPMGLIGLTLGPQILVGPRIFDEDPGWLKYIYIASSSAIIIGCISLDASKRFPPRLFVALGNASYSIYLFHWVVGWVIDTGLKHFDVYRFLPHPLLPLLFVFLFVAMVGLAYGAYLIVEKPLLGLSQAYWLRLDAPRSTVRVQAAE